MFLGERKLLEGFRPRIKLMRCMFLESVPAPLWRMAGRKTRARAGHRLRALAPPSLPKQVAQAGLGDRAGAGEGTSQRNIQVTMTGSGDGLKGAGEGGATSRIAGV